MDIDNLIIEINKLDVKEHFLEYFTEINFDEKDENNMIKLFEDFEDKYFEAMKLISYNNKAPKECFKSFCAKLIGTFDNLKILEKDLENHLRKWEDHCETCLRVGIALLRKDSDDVLLVQEASKKWGIPKGKLKTSDLSHLFGSKREFREELHVDGGYSVKDDIYIEKQYGKRKLKVFIGICIEDIHPQVMTPEILN